MTDVHVDYGICLAHYQVLYEEWGGGGIYYSPFAALIQKECVVQLCSWETSSRCTVYMYIHVVILVYILHIGAALYMYMFRAF